ncbi:MAG: glycosyltransferase family 39 protein [Candidatus Omnitrophica bacterium]|nr:glycosyltransferase family 39 protein [Candidatus Omnitrophota bacterium]MDD5593053.1 glycosyltransferase family 39 protein [Candidatus Omnitrophota bacterium]
MKAVIARIQNNYLFWILLWAGAILIFAYAWVPGGLDVDSCNYAAVAKEILRTHKWLGLYDPVYQGVFYYHFPLCIWATAFFFKFLGVSTFSAKLFSMLSAIALVGAIFYFGKLLKNHWVGFFAGFSFLFTNHIVRLSRQCRMDLPVSLFITLAILSFVLAQKRSRAYYLIFGLFTSLAIFAKDVMGLAPLVVVFIYLVVTSRWKEFFQPLFICGLVVAILPVMAWIWLDENTLFNPWLNWNFLHLLKSPAFNVPWYYYIKAIASKYFYLLPLALYGGYLAIKEARRDKRGEFYLLIIWAVIFPLAFSFGRQKLHYFILSMYPATSLLVGMACERIFKEPLKLKIAQGCKYILIIATIVMLCFPLNIRSKRFAEIIRLSPIIDETLKQLPEYEFIAYKQDMASLLFYSQELSRVKYIEDKVKMEDELGNNLLIKPRVCYMSEEDFLGLNPSVKQKWQILLKYKDRIVIVSPQAAGVTVILP